MTHRPTEIRNAFRDALLQFVDVVERVPPDGWDKTGLGEWTIRELVAHVASAVEAPVAYIGQAKPINMEGAAEYYARAMSSPTIHKDIAERARLGATALGDDPARAVGAIVDRTLAAIVGLDDDAPMATPFGTVRLVEYLPTPVLEVVVHTLDIADAAEVTFEPSQDALTVTLGLLSDIAVARGDGIALAMALSGRRSLPEGFNVLG